MFDELRKYKNNDHFFFRGSDKFEDVCNAPKNKSGVYVVYELKNGRIQLELFLNQEDMVGHMPIKILRLNLLL